MSPAASSPLPHSFRSPESELTSRLDLQWETPRLDEFGLQTLVSDCFHASPFEDSLLHHPTRDFQSWKESVGAQLRASLILPNALGRPSEAVLISREVFADYVVEEVEFAVSPTLRAPATVVIPRNGRQRHPAVVALHSMGGLRVFGREKLLEFDAEPTCLTAYREKFYGGASLQAGLARAGFLSVAIDAINFGLRSARAVAGREAFIQWRKNCTEAEADEFARRTGFEEEPRSDRLLRAAGCSMAALVATDDLRTVDYLLTRDDVDSSRIGCAGLSFGSYRANYLMALDTRVKAAASACWASTTRGVIHYNISGALGFFTLGPGFHLRMDIADIVALAAPKPFLAISGWRDSLMEPCGIAEAHLFFRKTWAAIGADANLGSLVYDAPHIFDGAMQQAAFAFLGTHLGMEE